MKKNRQNCCELKRRGIAFIIPASIAGMLLFFSCNSGRGNSADGSQVMNKPGDTASISFTEYEYDFGKVTAGEKIAHIFSFENRGTGTLVILSASTSCGCTVSKYDTKPIPPGGKASLEVIFDSSGRNSRQTKTITVRSNATKPVVLLRITGEVLSGNNN
jgi:hypothetical protein